MPLKQVTFSKKFAYAPFLNYDIGYIWEMEEGENREDIEKKLQDWAEENHRKNYPNTPQAFNDINDTFTPGYIPPPEIQGSNQDQDIIQQINECSGTVVLQSFQLFTKKRPAVEEAYINAMIPLLSKELEERKATLTAAEIKNANRIISNREKNSFNKLITLLNPKQNG